MKRNLIWQPFYFNENRMKRNKSKQMNTISTTPID